MKVGVIGCGQWGKNYVRVLSSLAGVRVARVADLLERNRAVVHERFPGVEADSGHEALLADASIDAVVVATPAASHFEIARQALERGKHVLVEKPLCLRSGQCAELTRLAGERDRVLLVGHTFLYNDSIRKVKGIVDQQETGAIYYMTARRNHLGKIRDDVSVLWDLAAHDVSIFAYLLGESPVSVSAVGGCYLREERQDVVFMTLRYPGGALGHIQSSWVDASKIRELVLISGKRRIEFDDLDNLESVRVFEKGISIEADVESFGEFQYRLRDGDILSPKIERREPLKTLCAHFLDCVREGAEPLSGGESGADVVRALEAAERSLAEGGGEIAL